MLGDSGVLGASFQMILKTVISSRISIVMWYVPSIFRNTLSFVGSVRIVSLTSFEP